jgi:mannose-6-phosphate isomerase-like protein (cupin superfamily)
MTPEKVNVREKLARIDRCWNPKIVGALNGQHVKLVKLSGPFVWHQHETEDELFLVVQGQFTMQFRDGAVDVREGEFLIVPRGVEHCPLAEREAHVLLFEPESTVNTGDAPGERTIERPEWI